MCSLLSAAVRLLEHSVGIQGAFISDPAREALILHEYKDTVIKTKHTGSESVTDRVSVVIQVRPVPRVPVS